MHPIAEHRRAKGLTQAGLAKEVGVSFTTAQSWERGAIPRARYLPKLAEVLGVDARQLDREIRQWKIGKLEGGEDPDTQEAA